MSHHVWRRVAALVFLLASGLPAVADSQLNVIVLLVDDLGWTDLGCFGSDLYETPHIDELAATGMRFTNAYSACTVCSPTRAAVLTGQSPARLHVTDFIPGHPIENRALDIPDWTQKLEHRHLTIAELFREAGYRTAHVGKWHLTPRDRTGDVNSDGNYPEYYPTEHGFDVNVGGNEAGAPRSYFWPYGRGKGAQRKQNNLFGTLPDSKDHYPEGTYLTDHLTDEALLFIQTASAQSEPFFLYFAYYNVHTPLQGKPQLVQHYRDKLSAVTDSQRHTNPVYAAMVHSVDDSVGRLTDCLAQLGIANETLIILTSDNGGLIGSGKNRVTSNLPLRQGKGGVYEGGVRVPAIVRWPGVTQPHSVSSTPVISMDIAPTVLEATGVTAPPEMSAVLDGVSLVPLLRQKVDSLPQRSLFWHYPHYHMMGAQPYSAVRSGDWKLIEFYDERPVELYNLAQDLHEDFNLSQQNPDVTKSLQEELRDWKRRVGAQLPTVNPGYDPGQPTGRRSGNRITPQQPLRFD